ncbi:MAG: hypothetical protein HOG15_12350 [Anaerolineae bacterium]|jgi:hypothetical protein|nr:hypothetical protein [Anaerolineae bacterium]MBT3714135.1 hypothetical protein [Anaerolineae bacterium]MBT4312286.1 hypothetical protein [Anaerolineae bacterium]MBT4457790.1 hypothetical protein [Anaerolineae bacterium]MBT6322835.1 hypothetical protein [Anaerolineae bacterium]
MRLNYEVFYETPDTVKEKSCQVCGSACDVTRGVYGPSNFIEAKNKMADLYDVFSCPNTDKDWHELALKLLMAIDEMPSKRVAALMRLDLQDLLNENRDNNE